MPKLYKYTMCNNAGTDNNAAKGACFCTITICSNQNNIVISSKEDTTINPDDLSTANTGSLAIFLKLILLRRDWQKRRYKLKAASSTPVECGIKHYLIGPDAQICLKQNIPYSPDAN